MEDGRTEDAKADFAKAASAELAWPRFCCLHALMCLESGDLAAYQRASAKEVRQLLHDPYRRRPGGGHWGVSICVLGPAAVADYSPVIAVAKQAADLKPGDRTVLCDLGATYFRAGHFEEARQALSKSESAPETQGTSPAYIGYFLAMTNQRLGRREEAQSCLAKASSQTEKMLAESKDEAGKTLQWDRRVTLKLLDAEAKALLSGDAQQKSP